jgi:hypothetical protein
MRSARRALSSSGFSPGMSWVVLEVKPWERWLRLDLAFPSAVFGPEDF